MNFPAIDYAYWLRDWTETTGNLLTYRSKYSAQYNLNQSTLVDCAREIEVITDCDIETLSHDEILKSLDLIYAWGGRMGRMFYFNRSRNGENVVLAPRSHFDDQASVGYTTYKAAAKLAQLGSPESVKMFTSIYGIGVSFASKFAYFWSKPSQRRLIILDAKIAGVFGFRTPTNMLSRYPYAEIVMKFSEKAQDEFGILDASFIEKALFSFHSRHFKNDNKGFNLSRHSDVVDFEEATRIGLILFSDSDLR